jgi:hypothetical protein
MSESTHYESIVRFLLPSDLLDYFEITSLTTTNNKLIVHLSKKNIIHNEYFGQELFSKALLLCIKQGR